jgi:hypothetical protein
MHVKIVASAKTNAEIKSFENICGPGVLRNPDGSAYYSFEYQTKREAIQWLIGRAQCLAFNSIELAEMMAEIKKYGRLTVDAITVRIERNK